MKFDDLDAKMRVFETAHDYWVLPHIFMVARLDGRGFTKLTKKDHPFETPFDERFRDLMVDTVVHLMNVGFKFIFGYTESDEISLLFDYNENTFGRKTRKINSILAGEASAKFSLKLGALACFDCRISELPTQQDVVDYFRWRNEDAFRNALNAHCYWALRKEGDSGRKASKAIEGMSISDKNEFLFQRGINFNDLPAWQKRGIGFYWEVYEKESHHLKTGLLTKVNRTRLKTIYELPLREDYDALIISLIQSNLQST